SPLTAVRQPKELMGEIAVKMLIDAMNGENATEKQRIILKSQLVKRASVKNFNPVPVSANSFSGNSNH
ncbi:MAG: substrate-binding domain-containing protein, partial [Calditrichaeota bacterium]|nr:substrate-binding domain-containing protein [Calditrichota bacterium]